VGSESAYYLAVNRNKQSIALNYDNPRVQMRCKNCSRQQTFSSPISLLLPSLKKRGIDYESLSAKHPRLIYCSITGYGFTGPKTVFPLRHSRASGSRGDELYRRTRGRPDALSIAIADMTADVLHDGDLAALFSREKTGRGQFLDMALFDSQLTWLANVGSSYLNAGVSPTRWGNAHPNIVPYEVYRGTTINICPRIGTAALWKRFVRRWKSRMSICPSALAIRRRSGSCFPRWRATLIANRKAPCPGIVLVCLFARKSAARIPIVEYIPQVMSAIAMG